MTDKQLNDDTGSGYPILFCIDITETRIELAKRKTPFEQITFLKDVINHSNIEIGLAHYSATANRCEQLPYVWNGLIYSRAGFPAPDYLNAEDSEAFICGHKQWNIYCEIKQWILTLENKGSIEEDEPKQMDLIANVAKLRFTVSNKQVYDVFKQLKQTGWIDNTLEEIAAFINYHVEFKDNKKPTLSTIRSEVEINDRPMKAKRYTTPPTE